MQKLSKFEALFMPEIQRKCHIDSPHVLTLPKSKSLNHFIPHDLKTIIFVNQNVFFSVLPFYY